MPFTKANTSPRALYCGDITALSQVDAAAKGTARSMYGNALSCCWSGLDWEVCATISYHTCLHSNVPANSCRSVGRHTCQVAAALLSDHLLTGRVHSPHPRPHLLSRAPAAACGTCCDHHHQQQQQHHHQLLLRLQQQRLHHSPTCRVGKTRHPLTTERRALPLDSPAVGAVLLPV